MGLEGGDNWQSLFVPVSLKVLICLAAPPSVLPDISPSRGEIGQKQGLRQEQTPPAGRPPPGVEPPVSTRPPDPHKGKG